MACAMALLSDGAGVVSGAGVGAAAAEADSLVLGAGVGSGAGVGAGAAAAVFVCVLVLLATGVPFTRSIGRGVTSVPIAVPPLNAELAGPGSAPLISPVPGLVVPGTSAEAICELSPEELAALLDDDVPVVFVGEVDVAGVSLETGGVISAPVLGFVVVPLPAAAFSLADGLAVAALLPMSDDEEAAVPAIPALA